MSVIRMPRSPRLQQWRDRGPWSSVPRPAKWALGIAFVVFLYILPTLTIPILDTPDSDFASVLFYPVGMYVLLAIGLNVLVGLTGLINVGYAGFFAVGGYAMALLGAQHGWSYYTLVPVSAVLGLLAGLLLGIPTLRLRGDYLAIVTLGFGEIVQEIANNSKSLGGARGIANIPHPGAIGPIVFGFIDSRPYDWMIITLILLVLLIVFRLERSRVGRAWTATRDDEDAAEFMGVPTLKFKLLALALSSAIGAIGGATYATKVGFVSPDTFSVFLSVLVLAAIIIGGSGHMGGVVLGAIVIAYLPERFRQFSDYRVMMFAAAIVIIMVWRPTGLITRKSRRLVAAPPDEDQSVPSQRADEPVPELTRQGDAGDRHGGVSA